MPRKLPVNRQTEIGQRLDAYGTVRVADLAGAFGVAEETIRRDLKQMAEKGICEVVHGGARRLRTIEPSLAARASIEAAGKARIARLAARLVPERARVLVDSGSTMLLLAAELAKRRAISVTTNSLGVALVLARAKHEVHILPGRIDNDNEATLEAAALEAVSRTRFDVAFVAVGGLCVVHGLTDSSENGARFRARVIASAQQSFLLADTTKLQRQMPFAIDNLGRCAGLVTNARPRADMQRWLNGQGIKVVV